MFLANNKSTADDQYESLKLLQADREQSIAYDDEETVLSSTVSKPMEVKYYVPHGNALGLSQSLGSSPYSDYDDLYFDSDYEEYDADDSFPYVRRQQDYTLYSQSVPKDFFLLAPTDRSDNEMVDYILWENHCKKMSLADSTLDYEENGSFSPTSEETETKEGFPISETCLDESLALSCAEVSFGKDSFNKEPLVEEPLVEELLVEEPLVEEPLVEEPLVEEPLVEEPLVEELLVEEPLVEEPLVEEPLVEEPLVEEPFVEEPLVEEPLVEEPLVEEPLVEEPLVEEPLVEEPLVEEPLVKEPLVKEPLVEEPLVKEPLVEEPLVKEPLVEEPLVEEPIVQVPIAEEPLFEEPLAQVPIAEEPIVQVPVVEGPAVDESIVQVPDVKEPVVQVPVVQVPVVQVPVVTKRVAEEGLVVSFAEASFGEESIKEKSPVEEPVADEPIEEGWCGGKPVEDDSFAKARLAETIFRLQGALEFFPGYAIDANGYLCLKEDVIEEELIDFDPDNRSVDDSEDVGECATVETAVIGASPASVFVLHKSFDEHNDDDASVKDFPTFNMTPYYVLGGYSLERIESELEIKIQIKSLSEDSCKFGYYYEKDEDCYSEYSDDQDGEDCYSEYADDQDGEDCYSEYADDQDGEDCYSEYADDQDGEECHGEYADEYFGDEDYTKDKQTHESASSGVYSQTGSGHTTLCYQGADGAYYPTPQYSSSMSSANEGSSNTSYQRGTVSGHLLKNQDYQYNYPQQACTLSYQDKSGTVYFYQPHVDPYQPVYFSKPTYRGTRSPPPPPYIPTIPEGDEEFAEWSELAETTYNESGCSLWEAMHLTDKGIERLKSNTFIKLFLKKACPIKVTRLPHGTQYKEIQNHFFNPNVLYIRHLRHFHSAYVVFRNYQEMLKGVKGYHLSEIRGKAIICEPSTMEELDYDYDLDVERRMNCTNQVVNKKYDTFIPNYHHIDQNYDHYLQHLMLLKQEEQETKKKYQIPEAKTHYVLVKPKDKEELSFSQKYDYVPIPDDRAEYLNAVYNSCKETLFFVSRTQSRRFQGYCKMVSEALCLKDIPISDEIDFLKNVPFTHVCRVKWISTETTLAMKTVGELENEWNDGKQIRYSPTATLLETKIGLQLKELIDA